MCGRYWADDSAPMQAIVEEMNRSPQAEKWRETDAIVTSGEICPTNVAPVIATNRRGMRAVFPMKWGFAGRMLLVNARAESAAVKPTFREAWHAHRCIVPAAGYFEWEHFTDADGKRRTGAKYRIWPRDGALTWLCGLYRVEGGLPAFVILTREPGEGIRFIHDRMPLILPESRVDEWIRPDASPEALAGAALTEMRYERVG